jgi:hypothetical protein
MAQSDKFGEIKDEFEDNWRRAEEEWGHLWNIQDRDLRAYAGDTWTRAEKHQLAQEQREALELPVIRSRVNWFTGYQRDNVKSMEIEPIEGSDQKTSDQLSKTIKQVWYRGQGQYHWNGGFEDTIKTGQSLFGLFLDFNDDPVNGDIKFYRRGFNSFALDPDTQQPDLSDCSWAILRDFVTRDQAKQLLPFIDEDIIENVAPSQRDNKFTFLRPFSRNFNNPQIITFDQYYRRTTERRRSLVDGQSGAVRDITDISKDELARLEAGMETLNANGEVAFEIREDNKEVVEYNILLSGEVVFSGKDALGLENRFPFVPIHCFFAPSIENMVYRYQGIVRSLYDAQRIFNKRNMKVLDIMDKVIYGSTKYMLGAVDDPRQLLQSGTRRLIGIQPGFTMDDVQDVQANTAGISDIVQYSQVIDELFNDLAGINETLTGNDEGGNTQVSGRLAQVRTANGVRANRKIFDQLDFSQQLVGGLLIEAIQKNYTAEKVQRMINEEPTEQFYDRQFEKFDAVVKQGVESETQQDQYYFELVNLKREGLVDVPQSEILKALPMVGKSDLIEAIEQQQQQQAEDQKRVAELEQMQKELVNAQIEQTLALAQERRGRVIADIGLSKERAAEAEENRASAALERAKTMVEIQKLNSDQIFRVLEFVNQVQAQEQELQDRAEGDIEATGAAIIADTEQKHAARSQPQDAQG